MLSGARQTISSCAFYCIKAVPSAQGSASVEQAQLVCSFTIRDVVLETTEAT